MSIRNQRTRRHEDDLAYRLARGEATVQDVLEHAQEIIVETPEAYGQTTSRCVAVLLAAYRQLNHGLDVPPEMPVEDLEAEL